MRPASATDVRGRGPSHLRAVAAGLDQRGTCMDVSVLLVAAAIAVVCIAAVIVMDHFGDDDEG